LSDDASPPEEPAPGRGRFAWIVVVLAVAGLAAGILAASLGGGSGSRVKVAGEVELPPPPPPAPDATPDPALVEDSPDGKLPIIGPDGRQPWQVYARPVDPAERRPRIALVVTGLGLDTDRTRAAVAKLPPAVTLAFSPYTHELVTWIAAARKAGHEVLLGLPMEPLDYPRQDPGPETLLTTLDPAQNLERLRWVMSRGTAYVGLVGVMGERFTATRASLEPVLDALKTRGLMFIDNHRAADSAVPDLGRVLGMAWGVADRRIDPDMMAPAIDQSLADLERVAAESGAALGLGEMTPLLLDRVTAWAPTLDVKGLALVPASAVAMRQVAATKAAQ